MPLTQVKKDVKKMKKRCKEKKHEKIKKEVKFFFPKVKENAEHRIMRPAYICWFKKPEIGSNV